jgi:HK97 family phage major capsid protein
MNLKKMYDAANQAEARVQQIAAQINDLFEAGKTDEALALRPQLDEAKKTAQDAHQLYISMQAATSGSGDPAQRFVPTGGDSEPKEVKEMRASSEYTRAFFDAFKSGVSPKSIKAGQHSSEKYQILMAALTETGGSPAGEDGGFLLPVEFDNRIKELMRQYPDLAPYVNVEDVTAYSGWRAVEQAAAALPFAAITENVTLAEMEQPKFDKIAYTVVDYGGYLPVSNDLLADTPANIMNYLARWVAKKIALTNTSRVLSFINALSPTAVATTGDQVAAIKTALNKTLDPVISAGASIFANQTGFDILDQLLDGESRPLIQPDPTSPTSFRFSGRPIVVLADRIWANLTSTDRARVAIGDGKEFLTIFRRSPLEMASTGIGGDAWRYNNTEVRAIYRIDEAVMDSSAMALLTFAF